jgi:hypothetical protein
MTALIGLGGYAYSGKDAFADVLENNLGWYKTYMSKALRVSLEVLNPIIEHDFWDDKMVRFAELVAEVGYEKAKEHKEVRRLLQFMGTEVGRKLWNENFWLDICFAEVADQLMMKKRNVVVTGIRYPNELVRIQNLGGITVWVTRPGFYAVNEHSSDNSLDPGEFDHTFMNNGTLEDLKVSVPLFVEERGFNEQDPSWHEPSDPRGDPFGFLHD